MAPKLYMIAASPPVRAVQITAKAIGLDLELVEVDFPNKQHLTPEYLQINPQHTVPTLVDDDGFILWDSHAIIPYLVSKYAKNDALYPKDPKIRAVVEQRLHFDSGVLWPAVLGIVRPLLYAGKKTIDQDSKDALYAAYDFVNTFLKNQEWIVGNSVTIADFSIAASISAIRTLVPVDALKYPNVINWMKQVECIPAWEVSKEGIVLFETLFRSLLSS